MKDENGKIIQEIGLEEPTSTNQKGQTILITVQYSIVPPKDKRCHHGVKLNCCRTNSANSLLDRVRRFAWSADTPSRSAAFNQGSL